MRSRFCEGDGWAIAFERKVSVTRLVMLFAFTKEQEKNGKTKVYPVK